VLEKRSSFLVVASEACMARPASEVFVPEEAAAPPAAESIAAQLAARLGELGPTADAPEVADDAPALAAACEADAAEQEPGPAAATLLAEAARLREEHLADPAGALATWLRAADADPTDAAPLRAARRLALTSGDVALGCDLLAREAERAQGPEAAALQLARSRLLAERLGRADDAAAAIARARAADPASRAVAEHEAALAAAAGRPAERADALERLAALEPEPSRAAALLLEAAGALPAGEGERVAALAGRALDLAPADPSTRAAVLRAADAADRTDLRLRALAAEARAAGVAPRDAALAGCELAGLLERLGQGDAAEAALAAARAAAGADEVALEALARAHEARGAWEAAAEVLRSSAARPALGGDAAALAAENLRLAELCEERLGRPDEAVACYRAALAAAPGDRCALAALGRLQARAGDWSGLAATFLAERDAASHPRERAHRAFRAAEVLDERLGRAAEAQGLLEEALRDDPALLAAHQALERSYERDGQHAALAALLGRDLEATGDREERIALLLRLARLRGERLGDAGGASSALEQVLELAPDHVVALRELAALAERGGRHAEVVALHERLAARTADRWTVIALLSRSAEVQEERLGDPAAAASTHERILALDPAHRPSLRALGRLWASAGRWTDLVAMHRCEAEVATSPDAAAALHRRAGEILEDRVGDLEGAAACYRDALTLAPGHVGAARALARVERARGRWEGVVDALQAEAAALAAPDRRAALLAEAGQLCEAWLGDAERALAAHEEALRACPSFAPSLRALDRLAPTAGRWSELAAAWRAAADVLAGGERAAALVRAAEVVAGPLADPAAAAETCRAALEAAPADAAAALLLSRLGERSEPSLPEDPLAPAGAEDPRARAERLEAAGRAERGAAGRAVVALRAGDAWETAGEPDRARACFEAALEAVPGDLAALGRLRRLHARRGDWPALRAVLQAEGRARRDPARAAAALVEAGELALSRLADPAGAGADWLAALDRVPSDAALASRLDVLLESTGSARELCDLREGRARLEAAPERAAEAWVAAARVAGGALGDPGRALADVDAALAAAPGDPGALLMRAQLLAAAGRAADAARDLAACLAAAPEAAALAEAHLQLAALHQGPLADPPRALSHLAAALAAAPDHPLALERLARLHAAARNWPAAADALRRLVALPGLPPDALRAHLIALAEVRAEGFGDAAAAAALCQRALELAPADALASERLARYRAAGGDRAGVVGALEAAAAAAAAGPARARAHLRAARVLAGALGDPRRALAELRRAVAADPASEAAREALADLLAITDPAAAVEEHRWFLADDPARVASWRALFAIFRAQRAHDRAFVTAAALRFLEAASDDDTAYHAQNAPQAPPGSGDALGAEGWLALRHEGDRGPLSDVLALCGDALGEAAELAPVSREKTRGAQPLERLVEELCANVGVEPFALRHAGPGADLWIEPGDPPAVRAGADLTRVHGVAEQRFLLARVAARLRARAGVATRVDADGLRALLAAAVRQIVPGYQGLGVPPEAMSRAVARALPRRVRRALEAPARAVAAGPAPDVAAFHAALRSTADRVGLLLAGDVAAALALVLREGGPVAPGAVAAAARARAELHQLLRFAVSEEHLGLRQRLRLAIA
jgi:tetratricopeptide (TPR) repeat protein